MQNWTSSPSELGVYHGLPLKADFSNLLVSTSSQPIYLCQLHPGFKLHLLLAPHFLPQGFSAPPCGVPEETHFAI
jgi:hypothetical protein